MDKQEIVGKLIEAVTHVQVMSGRSTEGICAAACPIGDVEGFDSFNGEEAALMVAASLGIELPDDYNPFTSGRGARELSIDEVADALSRHIKERAFA